ncbi:hypothetical protein [Sinomonas susongensis]|uniref:hypothetical protein n=1 Tax=Sinomonas susongensis TaxID=1324851 RepID=UPI0014867BFF|nr:hypothetical protein [Sinomonas susongensis]
MGAEPHTGRSGPGGWAEAEAGGWAEAEAEAGDWAEAETGGWAGAGGWAEAVPSGAVPVPGGVCPGDDGLCGGGAGLVVLEEPFSSPLHGSVGLPAAGPCPRRRRWGSSSAPSG